MKSDFLKKLGSTLGSVKTRSMLIVLAVFVGVVLILVWTAFRTDENTILQETVNTKTINPSLESLPGAGQASVVYDPLQLEENKQKAADALKSGKSSVARLVNQTPDGYARGGFGDLNDATGRCGDECYDQDGFDKDGYDKEGFSKQGLDKNGFNRDGYNPDGLDRQGFDKNGYDKDGFDKNGFDKNGFDKDGFDRFGYDKDGYDRNGCNRQGFNREGKPCAEVLFDKECFNKLGFDRNGCDKQGMKEGKLCYNAQGFNLAGFNKCGFDKSCFNVLGVDKNGCDKEGKLNGKACYNEEGYNTEGKNACGINQSGYDADGYDKNGFDKDGYDRDGYDKDGFDRNGCNREGKNRKGLPCYDPKGYTEEGYDKQGYDKGGYGRDGLDRNGYDKGGFDKDGYDKQGYDKDGYDREGFDRNGCNRQGMNRQGQPCNAAAVPEGGLTDLLGKAGAQGTSTPAQDYQRLLAEQRQLESGRMAELNQQQQQALLEEQKARMDAFEALMNSQAQSIIQAWAPPQQVYVRGAKRPAAGATMAGGAAEPSTAGGGLPPAGQGVLLQKAGDVMFGIIDTSINSDNPGPVLARIVSGNLKGARLLGSFQRQDQKVFIQFSTLSLPNVPESIAVDVVAIDPETARTALATGVDNHYLLKYGTLVASSFLKGMGEAVTSSLGTSQLADENGAIVASQAVATGRDQFIAGLGEVGSKIAEEIDKSDIPPTVTVDSGTGIGLLVMSDLRVEKPAEKEEEAPEKSVAPLITVKLEQ